MDCNPGPSNEFCTADVKLEWCDEYESDISDLDQDYGEDHFDRSSHESGSEISDDDEAGDPLELEDQKAFYGRNNFTWATVPVVAKPNKRCKAVAGLRPPESSKGTEDPSKIWEILFSESILQEIVTCTNNKLQELRKNYKDEGKRDLRDLDFVQLKAFLGLLIYTSAFKSNDEDIRALFAKDGTARDIFRCVMSEHRFRLLLNAMRFADSNKKEDLDPISAVFDMFISNCQKAYNIGADTCIDEMLVSFRGICKFKTFMQNKAGRYGVKLMCLTDAQNGYLFNSYIYCGTSFDGSYSKATQAVLKLAEPIFGSNRNITADSWFSSVEVVDALKDRGLTYVGPLKKSNAEIPRAFLPKYTREVGSNLFGFTPNTTILSHATKRNKVIILVSSLHQSNRIEDNRKPEIINYYNRTKAGVDSLSDRCSEYNSSRRTRRWAMAVFFRILDISTMNAYVLFMYYRNNPNVTRYNFLKNLAGELVRPELERRMIHCRLSRELQICIRRILGVGQCDIQPSELKADKLEKRKTCSYCPPKLRRKTWYMCYACQRPVCLECTRKICKECASNRRDS